MIYLAVTKTNQTNYCLFICFLAMWLGSLQKRGFRPKNKTLNGRAPAKQQQHSAFQTNPNELPSQRRAQGLIAARAFAWVWEAECFCCSAMKNLIFGPKRAFLQRHSKETNKRTMFGLIWLGNWQVNHLITFLHYGQFENHNNGVRTAHVEPADYSCF